jgi:hypothetical protein
VNDRELLEAAARAAGMQYKWHAEGLLIDERCGVWNPLTDDGDALRLAVKLRIDVFGSIDARMCETDIGTTSEPDGNDPYAAQRRAIVRAAAALQGDPLE